MSSRSAASRWRPGPGVGSLWRRAQPRADLAITEGAVRGLVRAAENVVPGVLIGHCRFEGDGSVLGAPVRVLVDVSVPYGQPVPNLTEQLRAEIAGRLASHTQLDITAIDIVVRDVRPLPGTEGDPVES